MRNNTSNLIIISNNESITRHQPKYIYDLAWPIFSYDITIPAFEQSHLNPLEAVIFELLQNKHTDKQRLVELTGLNTDIVNFIISRLLHTGQIDARMRPTEEALFSQENHHKTTYVAATVFYDPICRNYLPYIEKGKLKSISAEIDSQYCFFQSGTTGDSKKIKSAFLEHPNDSPMLTADDVLTILRRHFREQARSKRLGIKKASFSIPEGRISIEEESQLIYLHRKAFIKQDSGSILISNGFNGSINSDAIRAFPKEFKNLSRIIKERGDSQKVTKNITLDKKWNNWKTSIEECLETLKSTKIKSNSSREQYTKAYNFYFTTIYKLIEISLAKLFNDSQRIKVIDSIISGDKNHNGRIVNEKAKSLGFDHKLANGFFNVKRGTIEHLSFDEPEMMAVVAVNIVLAKTNHQHPFCNLAKEMPSFFELCNQIRKIRNPASHGDTHEELLDAETVGAIHKKVMQAIKLIGVDPNSIIQKAQQDTSDSAHNLALKISRQRDDYFTESERLNEMLLENINQTIKARIFEDINGIIKHTYSMLQKVLFYAASSCEDRGFTNSKNVLSDIKKKHQLNLPDSIISTSPENVAKALNRIDASLGANLIAFLYKSPHDDLLELQRSSLGIDRIVIPTIGFFIQHRKHNRSHTDSDIDIKQLLQEQKNALLAANRICQLYL